MAASVADNSFWAEPRPVRLQQEALAHHRQSPGILELHGRRTLSQIAAPPKLQLQFMTLQARQFLEGSRTDTSLLARQSSVSDQPREAKAH